MSSQLIGLVRIPLRLGSADGSGLEAAGRTLISVGEVSGNIWSLRDLSSPASR